MAVVNALSRSTENGADVIIISQVQWTLGMSAPAEIASQMFIIYEFKIV